MDFAKQIQAAVDKRKKQVNDKIVGIATDLFSVVVSFSPTQPSAQYSKGEFINNWRAAVNGADYTTTTTRSSFGAASRASIAGLANSLAFLCRDGFMTLSNSVHYADLVEYKGWPQSINPRWINNVGPYAPVRNAFLLVVPKLKVKP